MTKSQLFALQQWLTDFPDDESYYSIIRRMNVDEWNVEGITPWEVVQDCTMYQIAEFIEDTRKHFERVTND